MPVEMLTYGALAARLDISVAAARAIARRLRLPRSPSSDGKTLVAVDVDKLKHRRRPPVGRAAKIETLLGEITQLASTIATQRAEFERERRRADRLAADVARLTDESLRAREMAAWLGDEIAALRSSLGPQPTNRLGLLTASVVEADRRACSHPGASAPNPQPPMMRITEPVHRDLGDTRAELLATSDPDGA